MTEPEPALPAGYQSRPPTLADLPAIHALLVDVLAAEGNPSVPTLDDLTREFVEPWSDPATDARLVLAADGSVAALARVFANPAPEGQARAYLADPVHPAHAAQLHEAVLRWLVARGTQRLRSFSGPKLLRLGTPDTQTQRIALYGRFGFLPLRYFHRMRRDLRQPIPDRPLPEGFTLTTFRPELSEAVREAINEAFADHWGHEPITPEEWQTMFVLRSGVRPDLSPVVLAGSEVAALSMARISPDENTRQGYTTGWVRVLATRAPWRKHGLASALLVHAMRAFRAEGLDFATLAVDAANASGALGLYERLGFVSFKRFIAYGLAADEPHLKDA